MRVAVVVPAFRAVGYLPGLVASVAAQTRRPDELVVVDDASGDGTAAAARRLLAGLPFAARVIEMPANTGGPAVPLNRGIASTDAEYILPLDHDDELLPDRVEQAHRAAAAAPDAGLVVSPLVSPDTVGGRRGAVRNAWAAVTGLPGERRADGVRVLDPAAAYAALIGYGCYALSCSGMLLPRWAWAAVGGFDEGVRASIDYAMLEAVARRFPVAALDAPAAVWHHRATSMSDDLGRRFWDASAVAQRVHREYRGRPIPPGLRPRLRAEMLARAYALVCRREYRSAAVTYATAAWRYGPSAALAPSLGRAALRATSNLVR